MSGGQLALWAVIGFITFLLTAAAGVWVGFGLGLDHAAEEAVWEAADQLDAAADPGRHRHPPGGRHALPRAGRLEPAPVPFADPVGPAEYRLLTAPLAGSDPLTDSMFTQKMGEDMSAFLDRLLGAHPAP